jgi:hypothetical protein
VVIVATASATHQICIAEVAAKGERLDLAIEGQGAVALRLKDWYESHPPDIGNQTRAVLAKAVKTGQDPVLTNTG